MSAVEKKAYIREWYTKGLWNDGNTTNCTEKKITLLRENESLFYEVREKKIIEKPVTIITLIFDFDLFRKLVSKSDPSRKISLNQERNTIICEKFKKVLRGPVPIPDCLDTDGMVSHLSKCEVLMNSDGSPTFTRPWMRWQNAPVPLIREEALRISQGKNFEKFLPIELERFYKYLKSSLQINRYGEVILYNHNNNLIWELRLNDSITRVIAASKSIIFPSKRCSSYTKSCVDNLKNFTFEREMTFYKDFNISKIKIERNSENQIVNFKTIIEPKSVPSHFDERVFVSKFVWGVTLIAHRGCCGNHALIVVEGISDGSIPGLEESKYFMMRCDFTGKEVRAKLTIPSKLRYNERTKIKQRNNYLVREMLIPILEEQEKELFPVFKCLAGIFCNSKDGVESCMTWANKKLEIAKIKFKKNFCLLPSLATMYTKLPKNHLNNPVKPSFI